MIGWWFMYSLTIYSISFIMYSVKNILKRKINKISD